MDRKNVAIIIARMGSSRLPGKTLKDLNGEPLLARLINRIKPSKKLDKIVIATSINTEDDPIEEFCNWKGVSCFRGDPEDVLKRLYDTVKSEAATDVITLLGDNPLLHHDLVDAVVEEYEKTGKDYCTNYSNTVMIDGDPVDWRKFPEGIGVQVCSAEAIERAHREAIEEYHRIHAMTYICTQRDKFPSAILLADGQWSALNLPDLFLAVNTPQQFSDMVNVFEVGLRESELFDLHFGVKIATR